MCCALHLDLRVTTTLRVATTGCVLKVVSVLNLPRHGRCSPSVTGARRASTQAPPQGPPCERWPAQGSQLLRGGFIGACSDHGGVLETGRAQALPWATSMLLPIYPSKLNSMHNPMFTHSLAPSLPHSLAHSLMLPSPLLPLQPLFSNRPIALPPPPPAPNPLLAPTVRVPPTPPLMMLLLLVLVLSLWLL